MSLTLHISHAELATMSRWLAGGDGGYNIAGSGHTYRHILANAAYGEANWALVLVGKVTEN